MMCSLWLCSVTLLGLIVKVNSLFSERSRRLAGCQRSNSQYVNDTEVHPVSAVNCSFAKNLCCYRQGYVDVSMGNWTQSNGYASVQQQSSSCGANVYSVLESPWVNVSRRSCVEFTYFRSFPYRLQVFLAFLNGTEPSLVADSAGANDIQNHTARFDATRLSVKIQFRVKGGGASSHISPPRLYYVRLLDGPCGPHAQSEPEDVFDPQTCHKAESTTQVGPQTMSTETSSQHTSSSGHAAMPSTASDRDGGSESKVAIIAGATAAGVLAVAVVIALVLVYRRKQSQREGPETEGTRGRGGGQSEGFHGHQVRPPTHNMSTVHLPEGSDPRSSDATNDYLTPVNVYDGLTNENNEHNPYDVLANQNSTYEGLSDNMRENRQYDWLFARRGQSEVYEIPDTVEASKARLAETNRTSCEYYNQPSKKERSMPLSPQAAISSAASEYQNIKPQK